MKLRSAAKEHHDRLHLPAPSIPLRTPSNIQRVPPSSTTVKRDPDTNRALPIPPRIIIPITPRAHTHERLWKRKHTRQESGDESSDGCDLYDDNGGADRLKIWEEGEPEEEGEEIQKASSFTGTTADAVARHRHSVSKKRFGGRGAAKVHSRHSSSPSSSSSIASSAITSSSSSSSTSTHRHSPRTSSTRGDVRSFLAFVSSASLIFSLIGNVYQYSTSNPALGFILSRSSLVASLIDRICQCHSPTSTLPPTSTTSTLASPEACFDIPIDALSVFFYPNLYNVLGLDAPWYPPGHPFHQEDSDAHNPALNAAVGSACRRLHKTWHPDKLIGRIRQHARTRLQRLGDSDGQNTTIYNAPLLTTSTTPSGHVFSLWDKPFTIVSIACQVLQNEQTRETYNAGALDLQKYAGSTLVNGDGLGAELWKAVKAAEELRRRRLTEQRREERQAVDRALAAGEL